MSWWGDSSLPAPPLCKKYFVNARCPTQLGKLGLGMDGFQRRWTEQNNIPVWNSCVPAASAVGCAAQFEQEGPLCVTPVKIPESA